VLTTVLVCVKMADILGSISLESRVSAFGTDIAHSEAVINE
jgi:hypothetical protein